MADWIIRNVVDQDVQYDWRYQLKEIDSGAIIATYDIVPFRVDGDIEGTKINRSYLQPIEEFLKAIGDDLKSLGVEISSSNQKLMVSENTINTKINLTQTNLTSKISASEQNVNSNILAVESRVNAKIGVSDTNISNVDGKITTANSRMDSIDATIETLAPKNSPVLTDPKSNTVPITTNNTQLATTAAVKTYFDNLLSEFRG